MCDDEAHINTVFQQDGQALHADVVIGENDSRI